MIAVVDYGMGNLGSVHNMLKYLGVESVVTADPELILKAQKVILPGVGAFDAAMSRIDSIAIRPVLEAKALKEKVPVLGICLGMQLLTESSDEGNMKGLGWIPGHTRRFSCAGSDLKIPHMGWNYVNVVNKHPLTGSFTEDTRFYFVHSFCVKTDEKYVLARTHYGDDFDSVITNGDNIFGVQFHPEKSHKYGLNLLEQFSKI